MKGSLSGGAGEGGFLVSSLIAGFGGEGGGDNFVFGGSSGSGGGEVFFLSTLPLLWYYLLYTLSRILSKFESCFSGLMFGNIVYSEVMFSSL